MNSQHISGGGGTRIHVIDTGSSGGRPLLFIHGISQSCRSWMRQMESDLAADHRLVAMDLRGHGESDKPRDAYGDSKLWADDVKAVIESLHLDRPVLAAWSYGPLVALDYLRHYGEERVGGLHIVGGITKLGSEDAMSVLDPEFLALVPGLLSDDEAESRRGLESLMRLCFARPLTGPEFDSMVAFNTAVPAHVRQALFSRVLDNDDILTSLRKPVLLTFGTRDRIVEPEAAVAQHTARVPHAQVHMMEGVGHGPFWEDAAAFNARLRAFSAQCATGREAAAAS
jgi:pimeloyl-ACP methyl ester carboxylesterase